MSNVKTETVEQEVDYNAKKSASMVRDAANAVKPPLSKHVGSFVVHVYNLGDNITTKHFAFATQMVDEVPEPLAIEAAKELKIQMLKRYGHDQAAVRR